MTFKISRDGKMKARAKTENDAFIWLQKHQPNSWHHALTYEGYKITDEKKVKKPYITYKPVKKGSWVTIEKEVK